MANINEIPLEEIIKDKRVYQYILQKASEITRKNLYKYRIHRNQVLHCHGWLLTLHYRTIQQLQRNYDVSRTEFIVLLAVYLLQRIEKSYVFAKEIKELLSWMHNRIYSHLKKLSVKGYISIKKNRYTRKNCYFVTYDGESVILAFSQHYSRIFFDMVSKWGDMPDTFISKYFF